MNLFDRVDEYIDSCEENIIGKKIVGASKEDIDAFEKEFSEKSKHSLTFPKVYKDFLAYAGVNLYMPGVPGICFDLSLVKNLYKEDEGLYELEDLICIGEFDDDQVFLDLSCDRIDHEFGPRIIVLVEDEGETIRLEFFNSLIEMICIRGYFVHYEVMKRAGEAEICEFSEDDVKEYYAKHGPRPIVKEIGDLFTDQDDFYEKLDEEHKKYNKLWFSNTSRAYHRKGEMGLAMLINPGDSITIASNANNVGLNQIAHNFCMDWYVKYAKEKGLIS